VLLSIANSAKETVEDVPLKVTLADSAIMTPRLMDSDMLTLLRTITVKMVMETTTPDSQAPKSTEEVLEANVSPVVSVKLAHLALVPAIASSTTVLVLDPALN